MTVCILDRVRVKLALILASYASFLFFDLFSLLRLDLTIFVIEDLLDSSYVSLEHLVDFESLLNTRLGLLKVLLLDSKLRLCLLFARLEVFRDQLSIKIMHLRLLLR